MLKSQVLNIPTMWKDVILTYINDHQIHWNILEQKYKDDVERYEGHSKIFPPLENSPETSSLPNDRVNSPEPKSMVLPNSIS